MQQCAVADVGPAGSIAQLLIFTGILDFHDPHLRLGAHPCRGVNVTVHTSISGYKHTVFCIAMLIVGEDRP